MRPNLFTQDDDGAKNSIRYLGCLRDRLITSRGLVVTSLRMKALMRRFPLRFWLRLIPRIVDQEGSPSEFTPTFPEDLLPKMQSVRDGVDVSTMSKMHDGDERFALAIYARRSHTAYSRHKGGQGVWIQRFQAWRVQIGPGGARHESSVATEYST